MQDTCIIFKAVLLMVWVPGLSQVSSKWKSNTEYYTFKAIWIEKEEDLLHLTTGANPEEGIWNTWYYWTPFGMPIPNLTEIKYQVV